MKLRTVAARIFVPMQIIILLTCMNAGAKTNTQVKIAIWGDSRNNLDEATDEIIDILLNRITDWDFMIPKLSDS
jgi:hypothetical protein